MFAGEDLSEEDGGARSTCTRLCGDKLGGGGSSIKEKIYISNYLLSLLPVFHLHQVGILPPPPQFSPPPGRPLSFPAEQHSSGRLFVRGGVYVGSEGSLGALDNDSPASMLFTEGGVYVGDISSGVYHENNHDDALRQGESPKNGRNSELLGLDDQVGSDTVSICPFCTNTPP